jgi:hypothetical protein
MIGRWLHGPPTQAGDVGMPPSCLAPEPIAAPREPASVDSEGLPALVGLDLEKFHDIFLERVERASGSDPLEFLQTKTSDLLQRHSREGLSQGLVRFYDEVDERFGPGPSKGPDHSQLSPFHRKIRDEFKHDRVELERKLESWVRRIVEDPAARLKAASDELQRLSQELAAQIEATPARIQKLRGQRSEIRGRYVGVSGLARQSLPNLLKPLQREIPPQADELCRYGQLWIQELALQVRAEILAGLLAKAGQVKEGLCQLHRGIEAIGNLFRAGDPTFRNSESVSLGRSVELFPGGAVCPGELRATLADAFCSERRLAHIERRFQEEVLEAHGGLVAVMEREPRVLTQLFENDLFHRAAHGVGRWLESRDAASIMQQCCGSIEGAIGELIEFWRTSTTGLTQCPDQRVILALPGSPSGRSLRESLASTATDPRITDYVTIPDDVVLCAELENLSFSSVAAHMVSAHPWIAELAPKLVSRQDVAWADLCETI